MGLTSHRRPLCKVIRSLEIFAGAGGMALGLKRSGIRSSALVEWIPDKRDATKAARKQPSAATLRAEVAAGRLHGEVVNESAARVCYADWRGAVQLICGGPPCQPYSQAGRQRGAADPRDGWPHAIRAVREVRPLWGLFENVSGMLSRRFDQVRATIEEAFGAIGYSVRWVKLNAADYGVPQRRIRVFCLATRRDAPVPAWPTPTHARNPRGEMSPWVTAGEAVGLPGALTLAGNPTSRELAGEYRGRAGWTNGPAGTVKGDGWSHAVRLHRLALEHPPVDLDEPAPTLRSGGSGHSAPPTWVRLQRPCCSGDPHDRYPKPGALDRPANTVLASHWSGIDNLVDIPPEVVEWLQGEALTVHTDPRLPARGKHDPSVSCSQLLTFRAPWQWRAAWQTFPPDWRWQGSQTAIDRQIGNAVPPLLAEAIGREIVRAAMSG